MLNLCNLKIAHYSCVMRLCNYNVQSQDSENAQHNLAIVQILRLHGTDTSIYIAIHILSPVLLLPSPSPPHPLPLSFPFLSSLSLFSLPPLSSSLSSFPLLLPPSPFLLSLPLLSPKVLSEQFTCRYICTLQLSSLFLYLC